MNHCVHASRLLCLVLILFYRATAASELTEITWSGQTMGTTYRITVVEPRLTSDQLKDLQSNAVSRLKEINRQMSHFQPDSELSQFNRAPAGKPFPVSAELANVTRFALELCRKSDGAFDPTIAPLINLWGFGEKISARAIPSEDQIRAALQNTGCKHITVTPRNELVKDLPEVSLNLSAVAKGFAVDEITALLQRHKLTNACVSIGGEVRVLGHNKRQTPWLIGISAPIEFWRDNDPLAAAVPLSDLAISTSGDYQQFFFDEQGRRLCHILNPKTGCPVQHNLGSVSVVATNSMLADALATTLFVLGHDAGMQFIENWTNAAALFIVRENPNRFRIIPSSRFSSITGWKPPNGIFQSQTRRPEQ